MSSMTFAQRLEYSMRVRWPAIAAKIRAWGMVPYVPGSIPLTFIQGLFQEADYVMGEAANVAFGRQVPIASGYESMVLKTGESYRFTFEADDPKKNFTFPGDGFVDLPGYPNKLRIYKIAFKGGRLVDVDARLMASEPTRSGVLQAGILVPIVVIIGAIASALLSIYGYLSLKEVRKIVVSPSGFVIAGALTILFFPVIRKTVASAVRGRG